MLVKDLIKNIYTVNENITLSKAAQMMSSKKIGEIIFLNGGNIKGIITEDDLVRNFDKKNKIGDIMTTKVITIDEKNDIDDALDLMNIHSIKRLPVTNSAGKLVGIIRLIDIAKNAYELEESFFFE